MACTASAEAALAAESPGNDGETPAAATATNGIATDTSQGGTRKTMKLTTTIGKNHGAKSEAGEEIANPAAALPLIPPRI